MKPKRTLTRRQAAKLVVTAGAALAAAPVAFSNATVDLTQLQCGNLIYAGNKSSVCFADKFLSDVARRTNLNVGRNFTPVRLDSEMLFNYPFCVFSGEGSFTLAESERENLRRYLLKGGFLLASPGCSDAQWDRAFRKELRLVFPEHELTRVPMSHPVFSTVHNVTRLVDKGGTPVLVEGLELDGRLVMIYSKEGLNDVGNAKGCCCCGGNEIRESAKVNVNIFTYAVLY